MSIQTKTIFQEIKLQYNIVHYNNVNTVFMILSTHRITARVEGGFPSSKVEQEKAFNSNNANIYLF